ncbi:hypothetical protein ES703_55192 [subsurface metagenome]
MTHKHTDSQLEAFEQLVPGDNREKIYPYNSSITVVSANGAWGLPKVIVPINTLTDDYPWTVGSVCPYHLAGLYISASAFQAIPATLQMLRAVYVTETLLDQDSGVSQPGGERNRIYVGSTAKFQTGDAIWVMDDTNTDGEVGIISSIVTDDYLVLAADLTLDYDIDTENAKVYLCRRGGAGNEEYRSIWFKFSSANAKDTRRFDMHIIRVVDAGDGVIMRGYGEGGAPSTDVNLVYDDDWE